MIRMKKKKEHDFLTLFLKCTKLLQKCINKYMFKKRKDKELGDHYKRPNICIIGRCSRREDR